MQAPSKSGHFQVTAVSEGFGTYLRWERIRRRAETSRLFGDTIPLLFRFRVVQQPGRSRGLARFEGFELDLSSGELHGNGGPTVRLSEQPFRILYMLLERPGEVVSREEIRKRLWPNNTIVEFEHSISAAINRLRQVLGDSASDPHYVDTLARRGYRWMVPVEWVDTPSEPPTANSDSEGNNLVGKTVSHYRIVQLLGSGGMGVVYEADDLKLGRRVAMKFLPPELVSDPAVLQRFEREARSASALDHPNICTVHEVDEHEGKPFIVMQLLHGQTLRQRIETSKGRRPLPLDELLALAIQIAEGLEAAHQKGIVHRDIKPENIFITKQRLAKILDFGVAKLIENPDQFLRGSTEAPHEAGTQHSLGITLFGKVVGTAAYMSPEQVRGETLDARSDLFSFGLVLYEMATGATPFGEDIAARDHMLNGAAPSLLRVNPQAPARLAEIVAKALENDRELRYQSAADLAADLKVLRRDTSSSQSTRYPELPKRHRRTLIFLTFAVLLVISLGLAVLMRPLVLRVSSVTQITRDGVTKFRLVGDGSRLYYMQIDQTLASEEVDVLAAQVSGLGGEAVPMPWARSHNILDLSPDGSEFLTGAKGVMAHPWIAMELWIVPVLGGSPRRVGDVMINQATFTPDGKAIVCTLGRELFAVNRDGGNRRKITTLNDAGWTPRVSPDGKRVRLTVADATSDETGALWEVNMDGSGLRRLLKGFNDPPMECCGAWTADGRFFLFQSRQGNTQNIWALPEPRFPWGTRKPVPITTGPLFYSHPTPSRDGRRIFAIGDQERGELMRYDAQLRRFVPYLGGISAEWVTFSPDGQWVAYSLRPEGTLWRSRNTGDDRMQLTSGTMQTGMLAWSPDGKRLAFSGWEPGRAPRLYVMPAAGGTPKPVAPNDPYDQIDGTWSPDGKYLIYGRWPSMEATVPEKINIYRVELEDGQVTEIPGSRGLFSPRLSPDGKLLAAHHTDNTRLMLYRFATRRWEMLAHGTAGWETWSRDSKTLYYETGKFANFVGLRLADRTTKRIPVEAQLPRVLGWWSSLTPDLSPMILRDVSTHEIYALELEP
jgi:eukaryotic-like serine/threonine-protein kinase